MGVREALDRLTASGGHRGAALVEMAMLTPFLILLILGVIDSSWLVSQQLEVRGAAREAGRHASTNFGDTDAIVALVCSGFDDPSLVTVSLAGASGALGDDLEATVTYQADTITGFVDWAFNPPVSLSADATFRIEQTPLLWSDVSDQGCP